MIKLPDNKKNQIQKEIDNLTKNLIYFPVFIMKIMEIIENYYGRNSIQVNTIIEIQSKYLDRDINLLQIFGSLNKEIIEDTFRGVALEIIKYLKTLM